jgi:cobalt/nickel transport protein
MPFSPSGEPDMTGFRKKLWGGLLALTLLVPLGIVLPLWLDGGDAWGEWGADTLEKLLGYVPEGLKQTADLWKAPIADYQLWGENASLAARMMSYTISGLLGILLVGGFTAVILAVLKKRER